MGAIDTVTWQVLTVILTLAGLVGTGLIWRARGPVAGLRMLAVALLPAAAYLTGTLRLLWRIGDAVVSWAVGFAFSPAVWLGIGLALTSVLLFALAGGLRRRGIGGGTSSASSSAKGDQQSLPGRRSRKPAQPTGTPGAADAAGRPGGDDDMAEIEEILKRHGIS